MTLNELVAKHGLEKINSLTKYPSILTYHKLGTKGGLKNELIEDGFAKNEKLAITEKVDGTNMRIVSLNSDYLLGQRENFIYAKNDRIKNSDTIDIVQEAADKFVNTNTDTDFLTVIYGEAYGWRIQDGSKIYCAGNTDKNFRIFDVWQAHINVIDKYLQDSDMQKIVYDREHDFQPWLTVDEIRIFADTYKLEQVPFWTDFDSNNLPTDAEETKQWIESNFKTSHAIIGEGTNNNQKFARAEGVVIRTWDRKTIRKLRFEDYNKGQLKGWI